MREVGAVVARVHDERHAALDHLVDAHEAGVVHVHLLRVRMQLHADEAQADGAFDFGLGVGEVLVHGHEADEFLMLAALRGDEIVDGGHRVRRRGHRVHDEPRDGRALLRFQQMRRRALAVHVDEIELAHGVHGALGDLLGVDMGVDIDDGHACSFGLLCALRAGAGACAFAPPIVVQLSEACSGQSVEAGGHVGRGGGAGGALTYWLRRARWRVGALAACPSASACASGIVVAGCALVRWTRRAVGVLTCWRGFGAGRALRGARWGRCEGALGFLSGRGGMRRPVVPLGLLSAWEASFFRGFGLEVGFSAPDGPLSGMSGRRCARGLDIRCPRVDGGMPPA